MATKDSDRFRGLKVLWFDSLISRHLTQDNIMIEKIIMGLQRTHVVDFDLINMTPQPPKYKQQQTFYCCFYILFLLHDIVTGYSLQSSATTVGEILSSTKNLSSIKYYLIAAKFLVVITRLEENKFQVTRGLECLKSYMESGIGDFDLVMWKHKGGYRWYHDKTISGAWELLKSTDTRANSPRDVQPIGPRQAIRVHTEVTTKTADDIIIPHQELRVIKSIRRKTREDQIFHTA